MNRRDDLVGAVTAVVDAAVELVRREWRAALVAVLALFVFLVLVPAAGAAPAPPQTQRLADETAGWIEGVTRVELQDRRVELVDAFSVRADLAGDTAAAVVPWSGERTEVRSLYGPALQVIAERGRPWSPYVARLLIHELLHRLRDAAGGDVSIVTREDLRIEEGAVEALAADLWPAWTARFTGRRPAPWAPTTYEEEVIAVRAASALATGHPWESRPARLWRRDLWSATIAGRRAMMERATAIRASARERG